jgi:hypothetical protein
MPAAGDNKRPKQGLQLNGMPRRKLGLVFVLLSLSPAASALKVEPVVGTGILYTNNAKLAESNKDSDEILAGLVGARISESDGPFRADANTSLTYENYLDHTYGNQRWFNLDASAGWEMIRERLDWGMRDYFTQTSINNLNADTPTNLENTNVFSFGPTVFFPLSPRQSITLRPVFSDFYYKNSDTDNQSYGTSAEWLYQARPDMKVGLNGSATSVKYQKDDQFPDYSLYTLEMVLTGALPRSQYTIDMGRTNISRDNVNDQSGFSAHVDWLYNLSGHSSIEAYAATDLTDSSQQLLNSEINPATGDSANVQTSGDVLRNKIFRMTYIRKGSTLNSSIWTEFRHLDYKESPDDRKVKGIGAQFDYQVTALLTTGIYGTYNNTKQTDMDRDDKDYGTGVTARYRLSRKLSTRLALQYQKKDSTVNTEQYSEYSVFLGLVYGFGQVPIPGRYQFGSY